MTASEIFKSVVKGRNFVTPRILRHEHIPKGALEISCGAAPLDTTRTLYGVTVVKYGEEEDSLNQCFRSKKVMEAYVYGLKKGLWN